MKTISVIVEDDLYEKLKEVARDQDSSVSKVAKKVLKAWIIAKTAQDKMNSEEHDLFVIK